MDVLNNGYWHARSAEFLRTPVMTAVEWLRLPGDVIFLAFGIVPLVVAALLAYWQMRSSPAAQTAAAAETAA
jgi:nitric oxide reductase subunit B